MKYLYIFLFLFSCHLISAQCATDRHSMNWADAWLSCDVAPPPNPRIENNTHWIMYDLGSGHDLYNLHVWNYNHFEDIDNGLSSFSVSYSTDGLEWSLMDTFDLAQSNGSAFYDGYTVANLNYSNAQFVLISAVDNYGGDCYGLSEIRIELGEPVPCEDKIAMDVILAPSIIGSFGDIVLVTFVVANTGDQPLENVFLQADEKLFSGENYTTTLSPSFQGDPNGNNVLDVGEVWFYSAVKTYTYDQGDVFIISGGVTADADCGQVSAGAGKLLFTVIENALMPHPELEIEYLEKLESLSDPAEIYPNPAKSGEVVNVPILPISNSRLYITDANGSIVKNETLTGVNEGYYQLITRDLTPGIYFVTQAGLKGKTYKLIIQ